MSRRLLLLLLCTICIQASAAGDDRFWSLLRQGGNIVLMRHAQTVPGAGDPPGFVIGDCRTQRNLSDQGRADAARIGGDFRKRGIPVAEVLSSRWCRCVDTAKIAFGTVRTATMLDSMFNDRERSDEEKLRELYAYLARRPASVGNLVLVTHAQNISALTRESVASGEMVVVRLDGRRKLQVLDRASP
ncbi:histidine phosphatase family protein [Massilia sp. RP-1-19]|uniref:Histidine phosphatase family protein n=1 Tax=Massilia polaris TaxID=2728846 RepID=A0A848HI95_9BURK|nr:histidine phosphatase family protein [Massilia polaris]NML59879.1 histidine phosphatase family protein [Massilia polaris]